MKLKSKLMAGALGLAMLGSASIAFAETSSTTEASALITQIQTLLAQVKTLQGQLETLNKQQGTVRQDLASTTMLLRQLRKGMSGDDVKTLQEILATDPSIYPEGVVNGFYGPLTEKAVRKFQKKLGLEQAGNVGPKTLERLREIYEKGAGKSGKVPPGLLIAPGILKKLGDFKPTPLPGQKLPPGIDKKYNDDDDDDEDHVKDVTKPVITNISSSLIGSTTATVSFNTNELTKAKIWYATSTPLTNTASKMEINIASTTHKFGLTNLASSSTYYYKVEAKDASGNIATSSESSFATTAN